MKTYIDLYSRLSRLQKIEDVCANIHRDYPFITRGDSARNNQLGLQLDEKSGLGCNVQGWGWI